MWKTAIKESKHAQNLCNRYNKQAANTFVNTLSVMDICK